MAANAQTGITAPAVPGGTLNPTSSNIVVGADWMLQAPSITKTASRAVALASNGDEHAHAYYGERTTESANFTLGGTYTGNLVLPSLGSTGLTDWTLEYSETDYPTLAVNYDSAVTGERSVACPVTFPARTIGVPASITGVYTSISNARRVSVAFSVQHVEDTDGQGSWGTVGEVYDATMTVTIEGIGGAPTVVMAEGWGSANATAGNSNTALPTGSIVFEKHFATVVAGE